jgi:hypothetical protein
MSMMDESGDTKATWDSDKPGEVEAARATFDTLKAKGYTAFRVTSKGGNGEEMKTFDPAAEAVIMVPRMAGG